jgi:hypothetical protein
MVTGSIKATLDDFRASHGASASSYLHGGRQFLDATERLTGLAAPLGLVAGQCLELALKSYLLQTGMSEDDFKARGGIGHDLQAAWSLCIEKGLQLEAPMPLWAKHLHAGHERPFLFRYAQDNSGIVLPPMEALVEGLRRVLDQVAANADDA